MTRPGYLLSLRSLHTANESIGDVAFRLADHAQRRGSTRVVIPVNGQVFVLAQEATALALAISNADDVLLDGISVFAGARLMGKANAQRVTGVDLMMSLCERVAKDGARVLLLGGRPGSAGALKKLYEARFPKLTIESCCPPAGFEHSADELTTIDNLITNFKPDILFVGLGAPKQEVFIDTHLRAFNVPVVMAVGGSFEMISGAVNRAPRWMRAIGLEWFFRMVTEPRRLLWRYISTNTTFLYILLRECLAGRHALAQRMPEIPGEDTP